MRLEKRRQYKKRKGERKRKKKKSDSKKFPFREMRKKEGGNEDVLAGLGYEENGSRRWKTSTSRTNSEAWHKTSKKKKPICKAQVQTELRLQRVLRTTEKGSLKLCSKTRRTSKGSAHCLGQME